MVFPFDPAGRVPQPSQSSGAGNFTPGTLTSQMAQDGIQIPTSGSVSSGSQVFIGWKSGRNSDIANTASVADLMGGFFGNWSREKITTIGQKLVAAGWLQPGDVYDVEKVGQGYQKLLELTATMNQNGRKVTPDDVLKKWLTPGAAGTGRPSTYTETTQSVDFTNPKTAQALLKQSLQDRLGRAPTPAEQQAFMAALHAAEQQNPTVRTSSYQLDQATGQYQQTSTTTQGSLDAGAYVGAYTDKHNQKEAGAYQAATTYMDALMQAIGSTVG